MNRPERPRRTTVQFRVYALAMLLILAAGAQHRSQAQEWTTAGTNISNTNTGNVGIGTTSPPDPLSVISRSTNAFGIRISGGAQGGGAASNSGIHIRPDATKSGYISFSEQGVGDRWTLGIKGGDGSLFFSSGGSTFSTAVDKIVFSPLGRLGIGIAPTEPLHVVGNGKITGSLTVDGNVAAKYQDVAEWVPSAQKLAAGTVVVLDPERSNHVLASSEAYDTRVAGVVSAQPGVILGEGGADKLMVATTGRVRVRVDATRAPIKIGDLLVTGDRAGFAMKSEPVVVGGRKMHAPGTIIGKALEPLAAGTGEILVLLSLQ